MALTPVAGCTIALHAADVSLVLLCAGGRLPRSIHWGSRLPRLTRRDAVALARQTEPIRFHEGPDVPTVLSLVPEARTGWMGRPGVQGSRGGRAFSPHWVVEGVRIRSGVAVASTTNLGADEVTFRARDDAAGLTLELTVEMLESGLVRLRADLDNLGADPYELGELAVALPVPSRAREVLDFAGRWGRERVPQRSRLQVGTHLRESRHGRPGHDSPLVLHLGEPGFGFQAGEIWAVHTAWSGNSVHYAERTSAGQQVIGGGELLLPGEVILAAGERYSGPWVYGSHGRGLDAVAHRFHAWLRGRPQHPARPRPVTLNVWEAVYFDHDLARLTELAHRAASVGVERFVLDDGWFGGRRDDSRGLGDWVVSPDAWPDGLHPLVETVTGLGMEFGLWVEPEMINPDSDLARAHPDWILGPGAGRRPVAARRQQVLDLGIPGAYAHVRDQLLALLHEYPIAYLKWDHNRDLVEPGSASDERPGARRQTLAFYALLDEIRAAHPGLEIESCASGGARIDLEVMQRCERVWASDCTDPHARQEIQRWTTQLLPPELIGAHVSAPRSHTTGRTHDLSFRAGTAVFGHLGVEWDLTRATRSQLAELARWVTWHKEHRDLLHSGTVLRVDTPDAGLWAHGVIGHDGAVYAVCFTRVLPEADPGPITLPGLQPDRRYRIRPLRLGPRVHASWMGGRGVITTGAALASAGIRVPHLPPDHLLLFEVSAEDAAGPMLP